MRNICSAPSRTFASDFLNTEAFQLYFFAALHVLLLDCSPRDQLGGVNGSFRRGQPHRFALRDIQRHTFHLETESCQAGPPHTHSSGAPLPLPIRVSAGFFGDGLVREQPDPNFAAALDRGASSQYASRFNLAGGDPTAAPSLSSRSRRTLRELPRQASPGHAAPLLLAELNFLRHQHGEFAPSRYSLLVSTFPEPSSPFSAGFHEGRTCRPSPSAGRSGRSGLHFGAAG